MQPDPAEISNPNPDDSDVSGGYQHDIDPTYDPWGDEDDEDDADDQDFELDDDALEEFHDALSRADGESGGDGLSFQEVDTSEGDDEGEEETDGGTRQIYMTHEQLLRLLGQSNLQGIFRGGRRRSDRVLASEDARNLKRPHEELDKVPSEQGQVLMNSGLFGVCSREIDSIKRRKLLARHLMVRELGLGSPGRQQSQGWLAAQSMIPSSTADMIIHYNAPCYSGQFSNDGNFFFSCGQDFKVRMYDTSNPYDWKYYKTVEYPHGSWTITDATLSPDNRFLAYSSIRSVVCLASTDPDSESQPSLLKFDTDDSIWRSGRWAIWSIRFSGDGRELVAGTGDESVYVYDIEAGRSILRIPGHDNDVNAVCFADSSSPHILYSGSDDTTLKVWDRRSMAGRRPAGVFLGHTEGLTYVDSKGDGRYVLSNAKDQTAKLWDLRQMMTTSEAEKVNIYQYTSGFEYTQGSWDPRDSRKHPHDKSIVTFRGHRVLKTLIRCHFSPPGSTDGRYIYSGSHDGAVYVWNLDATLAGRIDVQKATQNSRPHDPDLVHYAYYRRRGGSQAWQACVRDASWHPYAPIIAATSRNGWDSSLGTCSVHTWREGGREGVDDGMPDTGGLRVGPQLKTDPRLYERTERRAMIRRERRFERSTAALAKIEGQESQTSGRVSRRLGTPLPLPFEYDDELGYERSRLNSDSEDDEMNPDWLDDGGSGIGAGE